MPLYDFYCEKCGAERIDVLCSLTDGVMCDKCYTSMQRKCNCKHFRLDYNNKTDMCDWAGNSSNYWNDVKSARERGEKVKGMGED